MGAVELLDARGLWLLAGIAPLIVLYILKIRRQRVRVSSTWLWTSAQRDLLAKHPFRKLVAELPLLLQILALAALALALARPAARGGKIAGDHVAIVVDTSASMGTAGAGGATRMTEAQKTASDAIAALEPGADALIIEGAREARVVSPLEHDLRHLRAAVAQLEVREVEGDLAPAVALAADRLRTLGGRRRIVVVTDGALAHPATFAAAGMDLEVLTVGEAAENAAIVRIDVRSGVDPVTHRDQAQVFAMIQSYAARPRDTFVTLTVDGRAEPAASRRVLVPAGEKVPVVLTFEPRREDEGLGLKLEIAPGDALPLDDVAYGRVPGGHKMPVTLATTAGRSWLERALSSDPAVDLQSITVAQLATVNVDPEALLIVEGACPAALPGHDVMVVAPPAGTCLGIDVGAAVEQPQLTSWESGDPRLRFLTLDGVHVARATPLLAPGGSASLVRAGTTTLVADASLPGRTATILGFDVGETDWPLKASFVLFVRNLVELARTHRAMGGAGPVKTGDPLRVAVPDGVSIVRVEGPSMADHEVSARGGFAVVPAVEHAGLYRVRWTEPHVGAVTLVANLTSDRESDVRPHAVAITAGAPAAADVAPPKRIADGHQEWGVWVALVAALFLAFDIWWLTRRARPALAIAAPPARPAAAGAARST